MARWRLRYPGSLPPYKNPRNRVQGVPTSLAVALKLGVGTALLAALVVDAFPAHPPVGGPRVRVATGRDTAVRQGGHLDFHGLLRLVGQVLWNDIVAHWDR